MAEEFPPVTKAPRSFTDPRLDHILAVIIDMASGNPDARGAPSRAGDDVDAIIVGLNMLGEELSTAFAASQRARDELEERVRERTAELEQTNMELRVEIAERVRAEQSLRESEELYRAVVKQASEGIVLYDATTKRVLDANPAYAELLGYTPEEMLKLTLYNIVADNRDNLERVVQHIRDEGYHLLGERQHRCQDGSLVEVEVSANLITYGGRDAMCALVRDISERKRTEDTLRRYSERLQTLHELDRAVLAAQLPETIAQAALEHLARQVSFWRASIVLFDLKASMAKVLATHTEGTSKLGQGVRVPLRAFRVQELKQGKARVVQDLGKMAQSTETDRILHAEGVRSYLNVPLIAQGALIGSLNLGSDAVDAITPDDVKITREIADSLAIAIQQARLHEQVQQHAAELEQQARELARSNAALEQFAYVASHDLQEPLRMVTSYLQLLERRYKGQLDTDADEFIAFAVDGATRMHQLIKDLLAFSRVGTRGAPFEVTDCQAVLKRALDNLHFSILESEATVTHDSMPTVVADPTQLGQLFQNLIGNALKFRGDHPPRIHVGAEYLDPGSASESRNGGEWLFSVQDNGIGIEPQYAERIFVIFQRLHTRDDYPGTGIGLALCQRIVERHDGRIWLESEPGQGSTFYFTIPDKGESFS